jgi:hypothetical protein
LSNIAVFASTAEIARQETRLISLPMKKAKPGQGLSSSQYSEYQDGSGLFCGNHGFGFRLASRILSLLLSDLAEAPSGVNNSSPSDLSTAPQFEGGIRRFPDCSTRLGGNQYINSASVGPWEEAYGDVSGRNCGWYAGGTGPV